MQSGREKTEQPPRTVTFAIFASKITMSQPDRPRSVFPETIKTGGSRGGKLAVWDGERTGNGPRPQADL